MTHPSHNKTHTAPHYSRQACDKNGRSPPTPPPARTSRERAHPSRCRGGNQGSEERGGGAWVCRRHHLPSFGMDIGQRPAASIDRQGASIDRSHGGRLRGGRGAWGSSVGVDWPAGAHDRWMEEACCLPLSDASWGGVVLVGGLCAPLAICGLAASSSSRPSTTITTDPWLFMTGPLVGAPE